MQQYQPAASMVCEGHGFLTIPQYILKLEEVQSVVDYARLVEKETKLYKHR